MLSEWRTMEDGKEQEKIRRGPHEYLPIDGNRRGVYKEKPYTYQEYPKVMSTIPAPKLADFKGKANAEILYDNALHEWDAEVVKNTVHNKTQEDAWLAEHKDDKVVSIADKQYPKTIDKTPAPVPADFDTLEDFRKAREEHKNRVQASIVNDRDEEEVWLREHESLKARSGRKKLA